MSTTGDAAQGPDPAAAALAALCYSRAEQVIGTYRDRGWTVACAESLTAGLLCATLADIPGASAVLRGGLVVYATDVKVSLAGVPASIVDADGAVAPTTATALAQGARDRCGADIGVALTGVAGPDPQEGKAVGTVYLGWATSTQAGATRLEHEALGQRVKRPHWTRSQIRYSSVLGALDRLVFLAAPR